MILFIIQADFIKLKYTLKKPRMVLEESELNPQ